MAKHHPRHAKKVATFTSKLAGWLSAARKMRGELSKGLDKATSTSTSKVTSTARFDKLAEMNYNIYTGTKESDISIPFHHHYSFHHYADELRDEADSADDADEAPSPYARSGRTYTYKEYQAMQAHKGEA